MVSTNCELREQRDKLLSKLTEMKDKIEILHAEISREGASKNNNLCDVLIFMFNVFMFYVLMFNI